VGCSPSSDGVDGGVGEFGPSSAETGALGSIARAHLAPARPEVTPLGALVSHRTSPGPQELAPVDVVVLPHPLAEFDDTALATLIRQGAPEIGSASVGQPNRGKLYNGVAMPEGPLWHLEEPENSWGTRETIESIQRAIARVEADHPGSPPLHIGHISRRTGGWLRPHRSHQSGRDVDLGYYYLEGPRWYAPATAENLDRARTWSLLMGLLTQGNVEYVFITRDVQSLLLEYARSQGVDEAWLSELFEAAAAPDGAAPTAGAPRSPTPRTSAPRSPAPRIKPSARAALPPGPEPVVRHRWGHHTHLHVRFYSDRACTTGQRTFHLLRKQGKL
jgi:penicillin-insensitive murein endopeptidase